jgi:hypothetical protein
LRLKGPVLHITWRVMVSLRNAIAVQIGSMRSAEDRRPAAAVSFRR